MSVAELAPREDFERTPPHDIAAEQCVLGGMMLSKDAISDVLEVIKPADHYRPAHQIVHETILDLYSRGEPADAITVAAELTKRGDIGKVGGAPYLHTLIASVPTAANAGYYARIVRERAILRRLVEVGTRIVQLGYAGDADADELVDRAQAEIFGVTERRVSDDYLPLSEIMTETLVELEAIDRHDEGLTGVPTGFADLDALTNGLHKGQMIVIAARPALGKALDLDTPLPTPLGWTTMGEVVVGDLLLGADGQPVRVAAATPVLHGRPCYEVEFSDGEVIVADGQHLWATWGRPARGHARRQRLSGKARDAQRPHVLTTAEIAASLRLTPRGGRSNHAVALPGALDLAEVDLPASPYALGVWLAVRHGVVRASQQDATSAGPASVGWIAHSPPYSGGDPRIDLPRGRFAAAAPTAADPRLASEDLIAACAQALPGQAQTDRASDYGSEAHEAAPPLAGPPGPDDDKSPRLVEADDAVGEQLAEPPVADIDRIPLRYLRAGIRQRRSLLAGLLDIGGAVTAAGVIEVVVASQSLAADIRELVLSLGYHCTLGPADRGVEVSFRADSQVFGVSGKQQLHKERQAAGQSPARWRYIVAVRPVASRPVRCVQVDSADQLYLAGRSMVPTHNSTLALDLARAASIKHGLASVIFSLEMSRNEITMRLLAAEARVALSAMRTGKMGEDDWTRLARRMSEVAHAPMYIDDSPNLSMMEIRAKCRRLKQRHDLRLVIIDYLQLMTSPKRVENRQQEVSEMSRSLKLLAKELDVPVIAVAQLNRGPEQRTDKRPLLSDLRESGSIEQDADVVILLHREDAYERESPRAGEADFIVAKHRNGPTTTVTVAFQGHYSRFVDMARI